jgi:transaldolase
MEQARADLDALARAGVSLENVTDTLLAEGIASFEKSFDTLSAGIKAKAEQLRARAV